MATTTPSLTLRKELQTETYNVDVTLNGNWDKVDAAFSATALATAGAQVAMLRETAVTPTYTGATAAATLNLQPTWNTTGIMQGLFIQVTHTAANIASRVIEVKRGSTTLFEVDITTNGNAVNGVGIQATFTGGTPTVSAIGSDTNVNLGIIPKGSGRVLAGTSAAGGLSVTGNLVVTQSAALTAPLAAIASTSTWNDAADTMIGWRLSVTDTASAAASLLLDLQVGGISRFDVRKDGKVTVNGGTGQGLLHVEGDADAAIRWRDRGEAVDNEIWEASIGSGGTFAIGAVDDAISVNNPALQITRSGTTVGRVSFPGNDITGSETGDHLRLRHLTVADLATAQFAWTTGNGPITIAYVVCSDSTTAVVALHGANNQTTIVVQDGFNAFTTTATTAAKTNIYWSGANSRYELENRRGSALGYSIWFFAAN